MASQMEAWQAAQQTAFETWLATLTSELQVGAYVTKFEKASGVKLNYKFVPRREGDVMALWADPTFANEELGWKAERTVEETLASAWAWEKHLAENNK